MIDAPRMSGEATSIESRSAGSGGDSGLTKLSNLETDSSVPVEDARSSLIADLVEALKMIQTKGNTVAVDPVKVHFAQLDEMADTSRILSTPPDPAFLTLSSPPSPSPAPNPDSFPDSTTSPVVGDFPTPNSGSSLDVTVSPPLEDVSFPVCPSPIPVRRSASPQLATDVAALGRSRIAMLCLFKVLLTVFHLQNKFPE
ncbi:hypothetical protein Salat_2336000 [Sesamum alatum]|uniref:Uncharacterized protein n=1 Tax=Sesamum alatum TaxID=300844 RepID=A0AAE1XX30_9LAMI|nr:hypothetical protein Salat_2336000 [Sesamum alatum]